MIPFFQYTTLAAGPVVIYVWGIMVALGIITAALLINYLAKKYLLSQTIALDFIIWALISAIFFARIFNVLFYNLGYYLNYPWDIFKIWQGGMSSLGGFFGAALALWVIAKNRKFTWAELLPYFDILALGLWLGWGIGRLGCFLIHDHQGRLANFFLAVQFPGGARFDLGLMESLLGFLLFIIFSLLFNKLIKIRWGLVAGWSVGSYALVRFFLDFLRSADLPDSDTRYWYLTPAQWGMLVILIALIFWAVYGRFSQREKIVK